jgi:hypothetical protein
MMPVKAVSIPILIGLPVPEELLLLVLLFPQPAIRLAKTAANMSTTTASLQPFNMSSP